MARVKKSSVYSKATYMPVSQSATRINFLAERTQAKSYLEIGVHKGLTFADVNIQYKVGVDPKFDFEYSTLESQNIRFFEETSDKYFERDAEGASFDIIFIDGLHFYEQTLRDFCNSIAVSHDKTVWIIDDVLPSDAFSALRSHADAIKFRSKFVQNDGSWHGDVYKVIFTIHDFFSMFSYVTTNTNGNPQTLLWREPRKGFQAIFNDLEKVSRLDYFTLQAHLDTYNFRAEDEALEVVSSKINAKRSYRDA